MTNFSFTVTLKPCMYRYEPEEQYDRTYKDLVILCRLMSNNFTIVAEVTKNCNLHYHGIIELHHKKKWYSTFRKSDIFGFTTCREQYDDKWNEYISKSLKETYETILRRPIIKDSYNIFTNEQKIEYGTEF